MGLSASHHSLDNIDFDNKEDDQHDQRLLSQFGIWFLVSLCTPNENTPTESLARLVGMVFQWFHSTAYMLDDEVGSLVEKLKPQFVTKWLKTVCDVRFDVMVMCLLPKPVEFARVRPAATFRKEEPAATRGCRIFQSLLLKCASMRFQKMSAPLDRERAWRSWGTASDAS
ncbi:hypothetical protein CRUP_005842 [Coryphaenoides rupestris]|nr:hypothetical protein CRUP_005842 [Coryphaenoides rupestris]